MTTLAEIEAAVFQLPQQEQERLLRDLIDRIPVRPARIDPEDRRRWIEELETLRASMAPRKVTLTTEQILDELREDRI